MATAPAPAATARRRPHRAGLFDIRNIIGLLLGTYGVILVVTGLVAGAEPEKTGDLNANLWTGIALVVSAGLFMGWAAVRPILVPEAGSGSGEARERDRPG